MTSSTRCPFSLTNRGKSTFLSVSTIFGPQRADAEAAREVLPFVWIWTVLFLKENKKKKRDA
jgi:hypothetical protein